MLLHAADPEQRSEQLTRTVDADRCYCFAAAVAVCVATAAAVVADRSTAVVAAAGALWIRIDLKSGLNRQYSVAVAVAADPEL